MVQFTKCIVALRSAVCNGLMAHNGTVMVLGQRCFGEPCHGYCYKRLASETADWMVVMGELPWWCRESFSDLSKVKLNHSCILPVTVERLFFLSLPRPFVFLYFIAFLLSLIDQSCDFIRNSSAVGEHEDPHSVARHLYNIGLVCISMDSYAHTVWLH